MLRLGAVFYAAVSNPRSSVGVGKDVGVRESVLYDARSRQSWRADRLRDADGAIAGSRVIFAGEEHSSAAHHSFQLDLVRFVDGLDDAPTVIGLEMCYRQQQPFLDAFVFGDAAAGGGSLALLAERTRWDETWGSGPHTDASLPLHLEVLGIEWLRDTIHRSRPLKEER